MSLTGASAVPPRSQPVPHLFGGGNSSISSVAIPLLSPRLARASLGTQLQQEQQLSAQLRTFWQQQQQVRRLPDTPSCLSPRPPTHARELSVANASALRSITLVVAGNRTTERIQDAQPAARSHQEDYEVG